MFIFQLFIFYYYFTFIKFMLFIGESVQTGYTYFKDENK